MVGSGSNDSNFDSVFWIPSSESVKDVDVFSGIQVVDGSFSVDLESVLATSQRYLQTRRRSDSLHLDIDRTPPNLILASIFKDDSLVFR